MTDKKARAASGVPPTDDVIQRLADEAETGYDPASTAPQGRPSADRIRSSPSRARPVSTPNSKQRLTERTLGVLDVQRTSIRWCRSVECGHTGPGSRVSGVTSRGWRPWTRRTVSRLNDRA